MPASSRLQDLLGHSSALRDPEALLPGHAGLAGWPTVLANGLGGGYLTAAADTTLARVRVDLYWPGIRRATIERIHADGTAVEVRGGDPARMLTAWARWDYEAPLDQEIYYRATSTDAPGATVTTAPLTLASNELAWLTHPTNPYLNRSWTIRSLDPVRREPRASALRPPLRKYPLVVHGVRSAPAGQITLRIEGDDDVAALDALLDDNADLLLRLPAAWGSRCWYVAVGQSARERADPMFGELLLEAVPLPFEVVDRPPGADAGGPGNTYDDLGAAFQTYGQATSSAASYIELSMATY